MDPGIDIFLPFEWVTAHPPQGAWTNKEIRFNSAQCLENCTKHEVGQFSLTWDETVATDPAAHLIGYVSAASDEDPIKAVPKEFRQYLRIMGKEAADALPKHRQYDCKIDLQKGSTAPCGPIYPLVGSRTPNSPRMAKGHRANRKNQTLHIPCGLPDPLRTQTSQKRTPPMRGLPGTQPHHNPKPLSLTKDAGTAGSSPRSPMVHKNGSQERVPPYPDSGRRQVENSV